MLGHGATAAVPDPHVLSMIECVNGVGDGDGGDAAQGSKGEAVGKVGNGEDGEGTESGAGEKPIEVAEQVGGGGASLECRQRGKG